MSTQTSLVPLVDLIFALDGRSVAEDHADLLWQALRAQLPWLADEATAGVHPLTGTSQGRGELYLSQRARLTLRLPAQRIDAAQALCGACLELGGGPVTVGSAHPRTLGETKVLYAHFVELGTADEVIFLNASRRLLDALEVGGELIAGKSHTMRADGCDFHGFSLMIHALSGAASLRLQNAGLGNQRKRGCGLFIPHKSVVQVGER